MSHAINLLSVVPMRKEPAHRSEMVSQLLFGDDVQILEEEEYFVKVRTAYDNYEGWVQANQLTVIGQDQIRNTSRYTSEWSEIVLINGIPTHIPFASPVFTNDDEEVVYLGKSRLEYRNPKERVWQVGPRPLTEDLLRKAWDPFLNSPYLWGGKSVFGIDCSGFAQQVFKLLGVRLMRDAYQQATQGERVEDIEQSQLGDLAFFQNENGRITHVGIILNERLIVHASGNVRIDSIDKEGILNKSTGKRTHHLHSIRRYF
jgi:hypothetical protein